MQIPWKYDRVHLVLLLKLRFSSEANTRFSYRGSPTRTLRARDTILNLVDARAVKQNIPFYGNPVVDRKIKGLYSCSRWNVESAGSSREWRPEGAPMTDETLPNLLSRKILSVVVVSVVFCPLQKKVCHWFTECITRFFSICVRYLNQYLQWKRWDHRSDWRWCRSFLESKDTLFQV
jgi:hypothetical protein